LTDARHSGTKRAGLRFDLISQWSIAHDCDKLFTQILGVLLRLGVPVFASGFIAGTTLAAPVSLSQAEFNTQATGLVTVTETFSGFALLTPFGPTLTIANGVYSAQSTVVSDLAEFCGQPCAGSGEIRDLRSFTALPIGSVLWGAQVDMVFNFAIDDRIHISVVGNSGALDFDVIGPQNQFFGFYDAAGLISVSFQNTTFPLNANVLNYSFDDVTTAAPQPMRVPEPSTLALLGIAVLAAGFRKSGRGRAQSELIAKLS